MTKTWINSKNYVPINGLIIVALGKFVAKRLTLSKLSGNIFEGTTSELMEILPSMIHWFY